MPDPPPFDVSVYLGPVPGDGPAGPDLRWEDEYAELERAREEEEDTQSQGIYRRDRKKADWQRVIDLGLPLLRDRTKDLQIAAWVAEAMARRHGLAGIRDGLKLLLALQDAFWTTAHPESGDLELREGLYDFLDDEKRLPLLVRSAFVTDVMGTSRYSFLQYKESRELENNLLRNPSKADELLAEYQSEGKVRAEDFDKAAEATDPAFHERLRNVLAECRETAAKLNESIRHPDHMGKRGPTLYKTETAAEEVEKLVKQLLAKKGPAESSGDESAEAEAGAETGTGTEIETDQSDAWGGGESAEAAWAPAAAPPARKRGAGRPAAPISGPDEARARIAEAAAILRAADGSDPAPYLVLHALRMGELYRAGSPLDPSGLPRPDGEDREELRRLANTGESWAELLEGAENALARPESGAWIDVYRYAVRALAELGHEAAGRAISSQLRAVLRDFPEWPETELRDGTPSASGETRAWLRETFEEAPPPPPAYVPPPAPVETGPAQAANGDPVERPPDDPWDLAQEHVRNREPQQAIAIVARAVRDARTGRERFLRTLQQAELCLMLGRQAIAAPLLDALAHQVDERHLDDWEDPALCGRVLGAFYRCLRGQNDPRAEAVYRRLCQLDIAQAMSLDETTGR